MRQALLQSTRRLAAGVAGPMHLPAPTGGWNTRDTLQALPITDAVRLTNFFPASLGEVVTRGGSQVAAFNIGPASPAPRIKSLYPYGVTGGGPKLFACADTGIYDISAGGDQAHAAPVQALTNGYWNAIQMTNSVGTNFLWGVNGTDQPAMYNGAVWAMPAITGPNPLNLTLPWVFKRRIFCIEKNSMSAWYLDVDSIQGTMVEFPVGPLFTKGGALVAGESWTVDGGSGPDDYLVLVTSEGEVAIYQGIDPSSATSFSVVGVFYIGAPLGRRCFVKFGGDLILLTEQGAFPLSQALKSAVIDYRTAVSSKIQPTFIDAAGLYRGNQGWEGLFVPQKNALIINVPINTATDLLYSPQFVMNTLTGGWCDFDGWKAACFVLFANDLFFGSDGGKVLKAWSTGVDNDEGRDIVCTGQTAFSYLTGGPSLKSVDAVRPLLSYEDIFDLAWGLAVDFEFALLTGFATRGTVGETSFWNLATWDLSPWSLETTRQKLWRTPRVKPGYCYSLVLQVTSGLGSVSWSGHDFLINRGGALG